MGTHRFNLTQRGPFESTENPSDQPSEFPPFLVHCGITSISVTPDTVMAVRQSILESEMMIAQGIKIEE